MIAPPLQLPARDDAWKEWRDGAGKQERGGFEWLGRFLGRRRCEPCAHLERLTRPGVLRGLVYRGGLRADISPADAYRPATAWKPLAFIIKPAAHGGVRHKQP
ncbi:MAG TPA: hypothetical protein VFJ72_13655 [Rubrobacteraceae bacterium]|nr:hypothetical protein [Rubrobacteraceae bacterium]